MNSFDTAPRAALARRRPLARACAMVALLWGCAAQAQPADAATGASPGAGGQSGAVAVPADGAGMAALQRASDATLGIEVQVVEGAASADTLGARRKGTGVVIGADGLVLTVGYLILEAGEIDLVLDSGRRVPARPVAYDLATGFGLVQALVPLPVPVVPLGDAAAVAADDTLLFVSGGSGGAVSPAKLLARGRFAGYWEYLIDGALFTAPARSDHSGAGLYNRQGELVGIGSLRVADASASVAGRAPAEAPGDRRPGNMFVPVDLLKPILAELQREGRSQASRRAWLGVSCVESDGALVVLRVSRDSPAESAGLAAGDRILALDGVTVGDLPSFYQRLWQGGGAEREVLLQIGRRGEARELRLRSVDRSATLKRATGI